MQIQIHAQNEPRISQVRTDAAYLDRWAGERHRRAVTGMFEMAEVMAEQLLTIDEVAAWLKINKGGVRQLMARNHLRRGVHYFRPPGLSTRFKENALKDWLDEREQKNAESDSSIKMVKGYRMK